MAWSSVMKGGDSVGAGAEMKVWRALSEGVKSLHGPEGTRLERGDAPTSERGGLGPQRIVGAD